MKTRSSGWFASQDKLGFIYRSFMQSTGILPEQLDGRPIIGIANTWSELTPCNSHLRDIADHVKRGVLSAGGLPLEFPVFSCGETLMRPGTMLHRNLASMDVEETLRSSPLDGVVLLSGCDKTTPSLLMGAVSAELPTICVTGGPMLNGEFKGQTLGSGTDAWRFADEVRAGLMSYEDFALAEAGMSRSHGHCNTMGTASTMACMVEALGMTLPGAAAIPAVDARRQMLAHRSGLRIVEMVHEGLTPAQILTREAFKNAIVVNAALGGSTNAVLHLLAIAGRVGVDLTLDDWDSLGRSVNCLVDLKPSGAFLMEDFHRAGGLPALMSRLRDRLHLNSLTVSGRTIGEGIPQESEIFDERVIRPPNEPVRTRPGIAVLRGSLAPNGAIIKPSAASEHLMVSRGRAFVFESVEDMDRLVRDVSLPVDESTFFVLRGAGPRGYPGMPEIGNLPIPTVLLEKGVRDVVRISDGRMSGTAYGTVVLHVSPESSVGGPLALIRTGDEVDLDVPAGRIDLLVPEEELENRRKHWIAPLKVAQRGYAAMYVDHVLPAERGVDFDFLVGSEPAGLPRRAY
jgi:L-arabonate dehydrase